MSLDLPSDLVPFVQRMVTERRYLTEGDVVAEALRLLQARETLRDELSKGFAELDAGLGISADQVYSRVEERIAQLKSGEK